MSIQGKDELKVSRQKKWGLQVLAHSEPAANSMPTVKFCEISFPLNFNNFCVYVHIENGNFHDIKRNLKLNNQKFVQARSKWVHQSSHSGLSSEYLYNFLYLTKSQ